jgi:hypothetical protein
MNNEEQKTSVPTPPEPPREDLRGEEADEELKGFLDRGGREGAEETFNDVLQRAVEQAKKDD